MPSFWREVLNSTNEDLEVEMVEGITSLDGLEWLLLEIVPLGNNLETLIGSLVLQSSYLHVAWSTYYHC